MQKKLQIERQERDRDIEQFIQEKSNWRKEKAWLQEEKATAEARASEWEEKMNGRIVNEVLSGIEAGLTEGMWVNKE